MVSSSFLFVFIATAAPRRKPVVQEEDDDLRELAAWAS